VKQAQSIEIAYLMNGGVVSVRRLSKRGELKAACTAFALTAALALLAGLLVATALMAAHRVVYAPGYLLLWLFVGGLTAGLAAARAAARARAYRIGANIDDDAFSALPMPLVRRTPDGYRIRIVPGLTGRLFDGRSPLPIESFVRDKSVAEVLLPPGARAELQLGPGTFVVTSSPERGPAPSLPEGVVRRLARRALMPLELTALASLLCATQVGARITEADMRSAIPKNATPWEIEKMLRAEAQLQARGLHQCFDVMPISCQRSGYVGVGLALSREGEIRSHWIARSTYGADCPVDRCMSDVVSTWFFEPLPESMKVILPVQVLRTDRPLPFGAARAAADLERSVGREAQKKQRIGID
jgi:hypothetical protein